MTSIRLHPLLWQRLKRSARLRFQLEETWSLIMKQIGFSPYSHNLVYVTWIKNLNCWYVVWTQPLPHPRIPRSLVLSMCDTLSLHLRSLKWRSVSFLPPPPQQIACGELLSRVSSVMGRQTTLNHNARVLVRLLPFTIWLRVNPILTSFSLGNLSGQYGIYKLWNIYNVRW